MGFLGNRLSVLSSHVADRTRYGLPTEFGPLDEELVVVIDGVGGFQFSPLMIRRVLGFEQPAMGTIWFKWQFGLLGEVWTDLMWERRNRVMGARLARRMLAVRRAHPSARIHLAAFSGGAGVAVFALEALRGRALIETLILGCPALSPEYNLGPALRCVARAYALISERDRYLLGLGTSMFGTTDRQFCSAAGRVGFRIPPGADDRDRQSYEKLREIRWTPALKPDGHYGGHTGWLNQRFLARHLLPMLRGQALIRSQPVSAGDTPRPPA
jgi:pimeloyl-ACP methyl ester carboxylesterase